MKTELSKTIIEEFQSHSNSIFAKKMSAYMKGNFAYFGISSPERNNIQKVFMLKDALVDKPQMIESVKQLWLEPQRELQYFAQEYTLKYLKQSEESDIELYEFMITHKSWWDSIDYIAPKLVADYFKKFPQNRDPFIDKWIKSNNIWLQRSAILFQLKYKNDTDTDFLSYVINSLLGSKEFFINKAIGWILREYGKTNPQWVTDFCKKTDLAPLSRKEGMRIILKNQNL